ncbi:2-succinyl-5-enolpyruvyl-6-hydroxy-3-cyclohexene-1-carboxylic-acid synthase [Biostraticola tofi]|uniref:2-succinyl-5-enolpyruvyl-6-hydroxy-3-cyclohexene-1-carboxylate synthase n=1 Tax=Biostraticola tofi TaxID=466109 RepID=A0A4R3Z527_9GAMM|nr:2-succinyl-5-enolpyruvyl-6-hydroxy-3-cyclohexene-1-carboxylic-acid synthase [Biostraticola tofi]TCW00303.1 2-succinyl-5-enolpyruvyl-6-hydroxy-3-cyclohexene-1-carboxylate synthase [Biostraticola tofi]
MSSISSNRCWATLLLECLTRHGVRHCCIAPGSRSTPLTLAAAAHPQLYCHTHFDERGLGHLALGLAKTLKQPVAVIVTSGTAAANLLPAVIEASLTGEPLIMLTADRPPELIDCGANQAIRQTGLFGDFPGRQLSLPRPTLAIPASWLASTLDEILGGGQVGAVHINCPFAEPLYDDVVLTDDPWSAELGDWWQGLQPWLTMSHAAGITPQGNWHRWRHRKGIVIAGRLTPEEGPNVAAWAAALGWPLLSDLQSHTGQPLPYADLWLSHPEAIAILAQAELVVQFGSGLISKRLLNWQAHCRVAEYWLIDSLPGRRDPAHHRGRRIIASVLPWLDRHPPGLAAPVARRQAASAYMPPVVAGANIADAAAGVDSRPVAGWATGLQRLVAVARQRIHLTPDVEAGEIWLAHHLNRLLPAAGRLFIGNSLLIRLVDALGQLPAGYPVFANRGASGIDGLLSTAAGVLRGGLEPLLVIIGDLSALYDLNALALFRQCQAPTVVLIINNNGGQIFSLLPTPPAVREQLYVMGQQVEFEHAAALFGLSYRRPESAMAVEQALEQAWQQPAGAGATVIELRTGSREGADAYRQLIAGMPSA